MRFTVIQASEICVTFTYIIDLLLYENIYRTKEKRLTQKGRMYFGTIIIITGRHKWACITQNKLYHCN